MLCGVFFCLLVCNSFCKIPARGFCCCFWFLVCLILVGPPSLCFVVVSSRQFSQKLSNEPKLRQQIKQHSQLGSWQSYLIRKIVRSVEKRCNSFCVTCVSASPKTTRSFPSALQPAVQSAVQSYYHFQTIEIYCICWTG